MLREVHNCRTPGCTRQARDARCCAANHTPRNAELQACTTRYGCRGLPPPADGAQLHRLRGQRAAVARVRVSALPPALRHVIRGTVPAVTSASRRRHACEIDWHVSFLTCYQRIHGSGVADLEYDP